MHAAWRLRGAGVALADIAACLYFDEMREDGQGWFHDRFVLSNGHDAIMTYGALAEHGSYDRDELRSATMKTVQKLIKVLLRDNWDLKLPPVHLARPLPSSWNCMGRTAKRAVTNEFIAYFPMVSCKKVMFGKLQCLLRTKNFPILFL